MVEIGYVEKTLQWKVESRFFPSKLGGKPAWLDLLNIPSQIDLQCLKCLRPCIFLCQIYAPIDTDTFHRTIFVFVCMDPDCCEGSGQQNFKVFRSQLKRDNEFYPYNPPRDDPSWHPEITADKYHKLCAYCGCKGDARCSKCRMVTYCCKEHQILHWKAGHKSDCKSGNRNSSNEGALPEYEILVEPESFDEPKEQTEEENLEDYAQLARQGALGSLQDDSTVNVDLAMMAVCKEDKQFHKFCNRIRQTPDQVLRHDRGGQPLWISAKNIPDVIPNCQYCGAPRQFEFQLLPQLLNYLNLDSVTNSIDWGTLAVFTCTNSCSDEPEYKMEYLWKQDISSDV